MSTAPGIGHNRAPADTDPKITRATDLIAAANKWITDVPEVQDENVAKTLQDFLDQLQKGWKSLDDQRLDENRAHAAAQKAKYDAPLSQLVAAKTTLAKRRTAYLDKKQAELDAERRRKEAEAKRIADEAQEAAAKACLLYTSDAADE